MRSARDPRDRRAACARTPADQAARRVIEPLARVVRVAQLAAVIVLLCGAARGWSLPQRPVGDAGGVDGRAAPPPRGSVTDATRLLVVAPGATAGRIDALYDGLRAAGLMVVGLEERAGIDRPIGEPTRPGSIDDARAALAAARVAFRDLELDETRAQLARARDELLRVDNLEFAREFLADVLLLEARAALQREDEDDARTALALLARLEPGREALHGGLHAPSLVDAYAAARAWSAAQPVASLAVEARAAGFEPVEVLLDGRQLVDGEPVQAGPHLVTFRARGAVGFSRAVQLLAAEPLELAPFLEPLEAGSVRAALVDASARASAAINDGALAAALEEVAAACAARAVLFLDGTRTLLWVRGRGIERLAVTSDAPADAIGQFTLATLQAPARVAVGLPPRGADAGAGWLPWVLGGAGGLVLLTSGVGLAVWALGPADPPPPPPRPVVVTCCVD